MTFNKFFSLLFFISLWSACTKNVNISPTYYDCQSPFVIEDTHPRTAEFEEKKKKKVADGLPGMTMLVESPAGRWAGAAGFADIHSKIPMEVCSISRIGSITKTFTATLILQLYSEERLSLDDPISKYLAADLAEKITNADQITITHLLDHTSGLADFTGTIQYSLDYFNHSQKVWTAMDEISYILNEPAKFAPGTQRAYTNVNYVILGMIAEHITGKTGAELYRERIFEPLSMDNTFFKQGENIPNGIVRGYSDEEGNQTLIDRTNLTFAHASMAGGIVSNVEDLNKYLKANIYPNPTLIPSDILAELSSVHAVEIDNTRSTKDVLFRQNGIGLGWFSFEGNEQEYFAFGHGGSMRGYQAFIAYFPAQETTVCYLINGNDGVMDEMEDEMRANELLPLLFE
ncbi:MAG: serine hydrolase domain-containing protein [Saprospiraceae bacterium]